MRCLIEGFLVLIAVSFIYLGALPIDEKCDLTEHSIDYVIDGAAGAKDMLDGKMDLFSYLRQQIAKHMKDFYDQSDCT